LSNSKRILVVEDELLIGLELVQNLRKHGYEASDPINSADLIFKAVEEFKPDLIIMDIKLQSYNDGIDAAMRIHAFSPTPIIFLTAYSNPETRSRADRVKPVAFLNKPVSIERLVQLIEQTL